MAVWTEEVNTDYNIANITVYNVLCDGVVVRLKVIPNTGYVMYDTTHNYTEPDPETGEDRPVIYYYRSSDIPLAYPNKPYDWVAVLEGVAFEKEGEEIL